MKNLLCCLLAALLAFTVPVHAQTAQPIDGIAAVVDEDVILRSELDRAVGNVLAQYANRQEQLPPRDVLERQVLERLILVRLQTARAASTGVRVLTREVVRRRLQHRAQNNINPDQPRSNRRDGAQSRLPQHVRDELVVQRSAAVRASRSRSPPRRVAAARPDQTTHSYAWRTHGRSAAGRTAAQIATASRRSTS